MVGRKRQWLLGVVMISCLIGLSLGLKYLLVWISILPQPLTF